MSKYIDGFADGYEHGTKLELRFLTSKRMIELIKDADYGCCHQIPEGYIKRVKNLKKILKKQNGGEK